MKLPEIPKEIEYKKEDAAEAKKITPEERQANLERLKRILSGINR